MAFDGKALCCRVQLYLNQWQLLEIREAHQGGAFHFTQSQLWHFLTNAGDEGRSSRTTRPKLPPDPPQDPVPSEAAVPQRVSSPGWTHSWSSYSVKFCLEFLHCQGWNVYFSNKTSLWRGTTFCLRNTSSSSNCKEYKHERVGAQHQKAHVFIEEKTLTAVQKKAEFHPSLSPLS